MNNEKIECQKCNSKFLTLGREKFECSNCKFLIIVKDIKKEIKPTVEKNITDEEIIVDDFDADDDLDLFTEIVE
jgi:hypothetical protein